MRYKQSSAFIITSKQFLFNYNSGSNISSNDKKNKDLTQNNRDATKIKLQISRVINFYEVSLGNASVVNMMVFDYIAC